VLTFFMNGIHPRDSRRGASQHSLTQISLRDSLARTVLHDDMPQSAAADDALRAEAPKPPPRILYLDHTAELGGAELGLAHLAAKSTLCIRTLLFEDGPLRERLDASGAPVEILTAQRGYRRFHGLRKRLKSADFDIAIANTLRSAVWVAIAKPSNVIFVAYLHDSLDQSLNYVQRAAARWALSRADHVLVNSEWTRSTLQRMIPKAKSSLVYSVSGVADPDFVAPRPCSGTEGQPLHVIFAGRLVAWKGPELLLDAIEKVTLQLGREAISATFCGSAIMGDPSFIARLKARAQLAGVHARFVGQVAVRPYLEAGDVFVHASMRPEPFGQVIVQAAAAGLCVVTPHIGGPREILADVDERSFFRAGDSSALAASLVELILHPDLRYTLAIQCSEAARRFSDENMLALHDAAILDYFTTADGYRTRRGPALTAQPSASDALESLE
jgi:glycosyltransferase involved in cell wall biosynthesis